MPITHISATFVASPPYAWTQQPIIPPYGAPERGVVPGLYTFPSAPMNDLGAGFGVNLWPPAPSMMDPFGLAMTMLMLSDAPSTPSSADKTTLSSDSAPAHPASPAAKPASSGAAAVDPNLYGTGVYAYERVTGKKPLYGTPTSQTAVFGPSPDQDADYALRQNQLGNPLRIVDPSFVDSQNPFKATAQTLTLNGENVRRNARLSNSDDTVTIGGKDNAVGVDLGSGNNTISVEGEHNATQFIAQDGDNKLTLKGQGNSMTAHLGRGQNTAELQGDYSQSYITTEGGDAKVVLGGVNNSHSLRLQGKNDAVTIDAGAKNNQLVIDVGFNAGGTQAAQLTADGEGNKINMRACGSGNDVFVAKGSRNNIQFNGEAGEDTFRVAAGDHNTVAINGSHKSKLILEGAQADWTQTTDGHHQRIFTNAKTGTRVVIQNRSKMAVSYE